MNPKTINALRTILLILIFALLALTAILYVVKGRFEFSAVGMAAACLLIYLVTKRKGT